MKDYKNIKGVDVMFEKVKEKVQKGKEWVSNNKTEIAYVVGCVVGSLVTSAACSYIDRKQLEDRRKEYPGEYQALLRHGQAEYRYRAYGHNNLSVDNLSQDMVNSGVPGDQEVIGAIVYTKKQ